MIRFQWSETREGWGESFAVLDGSEAFVDAALAEHGIEAWARVDADGEIEVFPAFPAPLEPNERDDVLSRAVDAIRAEDQYALAVAAATKIDPEQRHEQWLALSLDERAAWRTDMDFAADAIRQELGGQS